MIIRKCSAFMLALIVVGLAAFSSPSALAAINDDLIAHYPFDGNASDASGNGNHATAYNDFSYENGVVNDAINLIGSGFTGLSGGHVLLPSFPFDTMPGFTIGMWVKYQGHTTLPDHGEAFINFGRPASDSTFVSISYTPSVQNIVFEVGGTLAGGTATVDTPYPVDFVNNWKHLTLRADNGVLTGFLEGQSVGSMNYVPLGPIENVAGLGVHWFGSGESNRFIGSIDDVKIWDRALSDMEVASLVPEPSSVIILGLGCLAILPYRRRQRA